MPFVHFRFLTFSHFFNSGQIAVEAKAIKGEKEKNGEQKKLISRRRRRKRRMVTIVAGPLLLLPFRMMLIMP